MPKYLNSLCPKCGDGMNYHKQCRSGCDYFLVLTRQELEAMESICPNCGGTTKNGGLCSSCDGKKPSKWEKWVTKLMALWPWAGRNR